LTVGAALSFLLPFLTKKKGREKQLISFTIGQKKDEVN